MMMATLGLGRAALDRANAAFLCMRNEFEKLARSRAEFHRSRFLQGLGDVQSARVNQFECRFDFISILGAKTGATQTNHIYSENIIAFCRYHKRRECLC